jgi:glyoxylase I family protein
MMPVTNFSHVCIAVTDIERSLAWYREHLGFDVLFDVELGGPSMAAVTGEQGAAGRMVGGLVGGAVVELLQFAHQPRTGYTNVSFRVDDLEHAHATAVGAGADPGDPVDIGGVRMFFVEDPDGTPLEIIEYPGGARTSEELWRGPTTRSG